MSVSEGSFLIRTRKDSERGESQKHTRMHSFVKVLISNQCVLHTDCLFLMSPEKAVDWAVQTGIGLTIVQIGHSSQIDFVAHDVI